MKHVFDEESFNDVAKIVIAKNRYKQGLSVETLVEDMKSVAKDMGKDSLAISTGGWTVTKHKTHRNNYYYIAFLYTDCAAEWLGVNLDGV